MGMPWSMRIINGRRLRTVGDRRGLSPEEKACLDRLWVGVRDRDRRPVWRPRPAEGFPVLDGLLCAVSATDLLQCPPLIRLLRNKWTRDGWEDPLEDQEDTGPDADPWGAYGLFEDEEFADCFRGD